MFDWDKDVEELIKAEGRAPGSNREAYRRAVRSRRKLFIGLAVAGLVSLGILAQVGVKPWISAPDLMAAGFVPFHVTSTATTDVNLQVLDPDQANRFQMGLRSFSDDDLLRYLQTARDDLAHAAAFMRPSHSDAVALIDLELQRRDL